MLLFILEVLKVVESLKLEVVLGFKENFRLELERAPKTMLIIYSALGKHILNSGDKKLQSIKLSHMKFHFYRSK